MEQLSLPDNPSLPNPRPTTGRGAAKPRLRAMLQLLLLTLLAALLRRHAPAVAPLPLIAEDPDQDWWIDLPHPAPRLSDLLVEALPPALVRILYVLGPRRNRGMRALPRALPPARPRIARAPPRPNTPPRTSHPRQTAPNRGATTRALIIPIS